MTQAFLLGAGLGTRLRPLTDHLPKPLVPLFHRPLAAWTLDACRQAGIDRFAVNTHHLPSAWETFAASPEAASLDLAFFHEPVLLETGGGLKNLSSWLRDEPLLVHNGDIFTTLPLREIVAAHQASGLPATLALQSHGAAKHIAIDPAGGLVTDIRGRLHDHPSTHCFTGVYCVNPEVLDLIPAGEKISVIPAFLELARRNRLGAVVLDEALWLELGTPADYLKAHRRLRLAPPVHASAVIGAGAALRDTVVGPSARIGDHASLTRCVVWPGAAVPGNAVLEDAVVCR